VILIGENIHTMYGEIEEAVKGRNPEPILKRAKAQAEAGADYLDLNLCTIMTGAEEAMAWAVETLQSETNIPLVLDIPSARAMAAGLKVRRGKTVINGIAGTADSKANMVPLVVEHQHEVIMGLYSDEGAPRDAEERAVLAMDLVDAANQAGIPTEKIWIDPGVYPLANSQEQAVAGLEFLRMIGDVVPGVKTMAGVSNVSALGPPNKLRHILNRTYLIMAQRYGMHAAIVNVLDQTLVQLSQGKLPEIARLIHLVMDGADRASEALSPEEAAYITAAKMLLGREPYSPSAFKL
jgi:5-methyltetrahydrofolate corrinoid/iron sulfur protein methyltransferase